MFLQGAFNLGLALVISVIANWKMAFVMVFFIPPAAIAGMISAKLNRGNNKRDKKLLAEGAKVRRYIQNIRI